MNYYLEITKKVEEFCNTSPSPDERNDYLRSAEEIAKLHSEATALEEEGVASSDDRVVKIFNELCKILS